MTGEEVRRVVQAVIEESCRDWSCPGWWGASGPPTTPVGVARLLEARIVARLRAVERERA